MKYVYFVAEGPHDISAIGRILRLRNLQMVKNINDLDPFWIDRRMIPRDFPVEGDLLKRVPVPTFFQSDTLSIAVHSAGGDSKIANTLRLTLANIDYDDLHAFVMFYDADSKNARQRLESIDISDISIPHVITEPGKVVEVDNVKAGIYIFPNNSDNGTLETALLECAATVYPTLLESAQRYVGTVEEGYRSSWGICDAEKVLVGCISNVLKPGKANQVSLQDNAWISEITINLPHIQHLSKFVDQLIS